MMKNIFLLTLTSFILLTVACEKSEDIGTEIISNDAIELRSELQDEGYIETIVDSINKQECYFEEWKKTVLTPVSGLIEFYDTDSNWVATIDFGSGECDQWATKTWDVNFFPDSPEGEEKFSVFSFYKKEK
tara:strand:- start:241 stop:633 length:393 start_codon:yes stop_codon:yes gene_type:complete